MRQRFTADAFHTDLLVSGSTARARETADIDADAFGLAVRPMVDCDLCELHPGEGDGLTVAEYVRRYGSFNWQAHPDRPVSPGGESWNQFIARVENRMARFAHEHAGQRVVAVTHAGFIVWSILLLFAVPRPGTGARIDPDFASITEWEYHEDVQTWRLIRFNDTTHLHPHG